MVNYKSDHTQAMQAASGIQKRTHHGEPYNACSSMCLFQFTVFSADNRTKLHFSSGC